MKATVIGAGNMGGAIARGLRRGTFFEPGDITCVDPSPTALEGLAGEGMKTTSELSIEGADMVIVAVKPHLVGEVLARVRETFDFGRQMLFSVAAGVSLDDIDSAMSDSRTPTAGWARFRVMPNTAVAVGESMTFISARGTSDEQTALAVEVFGEMGRAMVIPERLMSAGMAVASCGIAFAMRYVRAAMNGAIEAGLAPTDAREVVLQTVRGAVELLSVSGNHPEVEIDRVTTPGGYTIRGLAAMDKHGFSAAVAAGIRDCQRLD